MTLQSNGSWVIISQVYNPNNTSKSFWYMTVVCQMTPIRPIGEAICNRESGETLSGRCKEQSEASKTCLHPCISQRDPTSQAYIDIGIHAARFDDTELQRKNTTLRVGRGRADCVGLYSRRGEMR